MRADLEVVWQKLVEFKVSPAHLAVLFTNPNESYIGEICFDHTGKLDIGTRVSMCGDFSIYLRNPKRLSRHVLLHQQTGQMTQDVRVSDLEFFNEGVVEFRPKGGFMLAWCDEITRISHMITYLNFLEGRLRERAKRAGLALPEESPSPAKLAELAARLKGSPELEKKTG